MRNLESCSKIKPMTVQEAARAMATLAPRAEGPLGLGIWEGAVVSSIDQKGHAGDHVAVFSDSKLISPFGPRGDEDSEAMAALFVIAVHNAEKIALALEQGTTTSICYDSKATPVGLPERDLVLYGTSHDQFDVKGPEMGSWDSVNQRWLNQRNEELGWHPTHYAVPPVNPLVAQEKVAEVAGA